MLIVSDPFMLRHDPGPGHPECPERLEAACEALARRVDLRWKLPQPAPREILQRVHSAAHIQEVERLRGQSGALDPDTYLSADSVAAAYLAAGAGIEAVTEVVQGQERRALALVRPPGHHAEVDAALGFCIFNNVAIAAAHALADLGCARVLVVDWDVHHGNGTQHIFSARRDLLFFSVHRYPFYPGTGAHDERGEGAGEGYTVNVPLAQGAGDGDFLAAFEALLRPIADRYAPDLVLVSAGFDAHRRDPLGGMNVSDDGYAAMAATVRDIADRHAGGRLVLFLEGGYDLEALGSGLGACLDAIGGAAPPAVAGPGTKGAAAVAAAVAQHRRLWGL
jgi:acetoin utilization deacetylase AcuC-like enzyme